MPQYRERVGDNSQDGNYRGPIFLVYLRTLAVAKLAFIPGLALIGRHLSREDGDADSFLRQNSFEPTRYVPLRRVNGINLAFSAAG